VVGNWNAHRVDGARHTLGPVGRGASASSIEEGAFQTNPPRNSAILLRFTTRALFRPLQIRHHVLPVRLNEFLLVAPHIVHVDLAETEVNIMLNERDVIVEIRRH